MSLDDVEVENDLTPVPELCIESGLPRERIIRLIQGGQVPGEFHADRPANTSRWFASRIGIRYYVSDNHPEARRDADFEAVTLIIDQRARALAEASSPSAADAETLRRYRVLRGLIGSVDSEWTDTLPATIPSSTD